MSDTRKTIVNEIEVDTEVADRMLNKLIMREKNNISTKQFNDGEMVRKIKDMIEEETKCY